MGPPSVSRSQSGTSLDHPCLVRNIIPNYLISLGAVWAEEKNGQPVLSVRLEWATQVTETSFYETLRNLPEAKTHLILGPNIK